MSQVDALQRAARALLKRPLIRSTEADEFRLLRAQLAELRSWFDANTGWRLHADTDVIRLHKEPAGNNDATRPARDPRNRTPFGRRRYVLFCLCLAALERADAQIPLGRLAEQVLLLARGPALADAGVEFTLTGRDQKADLVAVVHLLLHWGVLARVAGDEEEYLRGTGDVLYDVSRRVLAQLLVARRGPSTVALEAFEERIAALGSVEALESDEATRRRIRHRLTRRLLDDPVVYFDELGADEAEYLRSQRPAIVRRITELTGLVAEVRAEGIAMVDLEDDLSDVGLPEPGTHGHLTLLLAEHLARTGTDEHRLEDLQDHTRDLAARHRRIWRKGASEPGAEVALTEAALERLAALRLIERRGDRIRARPALARFAVTDPILPPAPAAAVVASLFGEAGDA